jgi:hypothetical protein
MLARATASASNAPRLAVLRDLVTPRRYAERSCLSSHRRVRIRQADRARASNRRASIPREQRRPVTSEPGVHHDLVLIDQTQLRQGQGELHACHEQSLSRLPLELGNGPYVPKGPPWPGEDQSWSPAAFFPAWLRAARAARAQLAAAERPASTVRGPVVHSPPVTVSAHENISQACTAHGRMPPLPGSATPMRRTSPSSSGR